jgi:hypothetical protein
LEVTSESDELERAVAQENAVAAAERGEQSPPRGHGLVAAVVIGAAFSGLVRDAVSRVRRST